MNWRTNSEIDIDKMLVIIFSVYSLLLIFSAISIHPTMTGDGAEYLGMTVSFFNHLSADLREEDIALREIIWNKNGIVPDRNLTYSGYFKSLGGDYYSYHFWAYSLFNLPVFVLLHYFDFNELRSFQITNSLLLVLSLLILLSITNLTKSQKTWLFLFSASSPILVYINWTHSEVFTYSFIVASVAFYLKKDYRLAALASSLASLQNPPILIFTFFIILYGWKSSELQLRELLNLLICTSISVIPFLFYYLNFHTTSLIVSSGSSDISYISINKIFSLFFDLNFGMVVYIAPLMFLAIFVLIASIARNDLTVPCLWLVLIVMAVMCSTAGNWNSGMMYINRYAVWMLPIIVLICIYELPKFSTVNINKYLFVSFLVSLLLIGTLLYNHDGENYIRFNFLSKEVLINTPGLYNPPYDVYAERALGGEVRFDDRLPIIFTYNGIPRKALTDYEGLGPIERFTGNPLNNETYEQIRKSKVGYVNFGNKLFKFPHDKSELIIFDKKMILDILSGRLSFSNEGWHGIEDWSGTPTRWMQADSTIAVNSPENRTATLSLNVLSFYRNRTLEVSAGGVPAIKVVVPTSFIYLSAPILLLNGTNTLSLHVSEGCERPSDKPELNNHDGRCLSLAVQNFNIM